MLSYRGSFSVYFHRHTDAPRVWIVAARDRSWEISVVAVDIRVPVATVYAPAPHAYADDGPPSAYLVGHGLVDVDGDGNATISGPAMGRTLALRIARTTKHGPGGTGGPGPCDPDCLKCEACRVLELGE